VIGHNVTHFFCYFTFPETQKKFFDQIRGNIALGSLQYLMMYTLGLADGNLMARSYVIAYSYPPEPQMESSRKLPHQSSSNEARRHRSQASPRHQYVLKYARCKKSHNA
jgi:hypothetical protein